MLVQASKSTEKCRAFQSASEANHIPRFDHAAIVTAVCGEKSWRVDPLPLNLSTFSPMLRKMSEAISTFGDIICSCVRQNATTAGPLSPLDYVVASAQKPVTAVSLYPPTYSAPYTISRAEKYTTESSGLGSENGMYSHKILYLLVAERFKLGHPKRRCERFLDKRACLIIIPIIEAEFVAHQAGGGRSLAHLFRAIIYTYI